MPRAACSARAPEGVGEHLVLKAEAQGHEVRVMIDSGATGNFVTKEAAIRCKIPIRGKARMDRYKLTVIDGRDINEHNGEITKETKKFELILGEHHEDISLDIVDMADHEIVLGEPWLRKHNPFVDWKARTLTFQSCQCKGALKPQEASSKLREEVEQLKSQLRSRQTVHGTGKHSLNQPLGWLLSGKLEQKEDSKVEVPLPYRKFKELWEARPPGKLPPHRPWDHEIPLLEGKQPKKMGVRPMSPAKRETAKQYIKENLDKGFIRTSTSPAGYPPLIVPKDGGKERFCIDYRHLNDITVKNSYPLPLITELQDAVRGKKVLTVIDLPGAFNLIRMKEGEEWKTAFRCLGELYEYTVMPFGLTNAPATFQAAINGVLREHLGKTCVVYIDDVLIFSDTEEQHVKDVQAVMSKLQNEGFKLEARKCQFHKKEVKFLGNLVSGQGLRMDPAKVEAVKNWPKPETVKGVQAFLGFANFQRRYIKDFSEILAPLSGLTKKDTPFEWTTDCQQAFDRVKKAITSAPVLRLFDHSKPAIIETDASDKAIGAVLLQEDEQGRMHPVAFYSRKLTAPELNYDIHDKELLAIVVALEEWEHYLQGATHETLILTDHKNLALFTTTKTLNRRQIRWYEQIASYNFVIRYRKGSENGRADALSRREDYMSALENKDHKILREDPDGLRYAGRIMATAYTNNAENQRDLLADIRKAQSTDKVVQQLIQQAETTNEISINQGLVLFQGKIYVPESQKRAVFEDHHDAPIAGHRGVSTTCERISKQFYFPRLRKYVQKAIAGCNVCQKTKHSRHQKYGLLQPLPSPEKPWQSISMDFIVKLPLSKEPMTGSTFDSVLVIVDRFSKYAHFVPYKEATTATNFSYVFSRTVFANHGIPIDIVSDRDKTFVSTFWQSLLQSLGVKSKMSTAFHPQTDGQTERVNQTLEQWLRAYVDKQQDNWVSLLPVAQFAYNSARGETLGQSPFEVVYGFQPKAFTYHGDTTNPEANLSASELTELHEEVRRDLDFTRWRMSVYANINRSEGPDLKEGDNAYLIRRNLRTKRPSDKLDFVKLGPFRVTRQTGPVNFELELPKSMKVHPVFHASLLEKADKSVPLDKEQELESIEEFEVEQILGERKRRGRTEYLVKWKGWPDESNTWEPTHHLKNSQAAIREYRTGSTPRDRSRQ